LVSAIESRGQSTVITRDGRAVAVLVSVSEYQRMEEEAWAGRMLRELPEALADVKRGDGIPHEQVARELAARYAKLSSR
jgi:PHD/YefM family antitoxin component YafN of YafNO toxin-antitoxin module